MRDLGAHEDRLLVLPFNTNEDSKILPDGTLMWCAWETHHRRDEYLERARQYLVESRTTPQQLMDTIEKQGRRSIHLAGCYWLHPRNVESVTAEYGPYGYPTGTYPYMVAWIEDTGKYSYI